MKFYITVLKIAKICYNCTHNYKVLKEQFTKRGHDLSYNETEIKRLNFSIGKNC